MEAHKARCSRGGDCDPAERSQPLQGVPWEHPSGSTALNPGVLCILYHLCINNYFLQTVHFCGAHDPAPWGDAQLKPCPVIDRQWSQPGLNPSEILRERGKAQSSQHHGNYHVKSWKSEGPKHKGKPQLLRQLKSCLQWNDFNSAIRIC